MLQIFNPKWWSLKGTEEETQKNLNDQSYKNQLDLLAIDIHAIKVNNSDYINKRNQQIIDNMKLAKLKYYKANEYDNINWRYVFKLDTQDNLTIEKV